MNFTDEEIKIAKQTRETVISTDVPELKAVYMAGEICMWDELRELKANEASKSTSKLPVGSVVVSLPTDSREFKEWQQSNSIERLTGTNDYSWGGFIYQRLFFLEKFMEAQNKSN